MTLIPRIEQATAEQVPEAAATADVQYHYLLSLEAMER